MTNSCLPPSTIPTSPYSTKPQNRTSRLSLDRQLLAVCGSHAVHRCQVGSGQPAGHDGGKHQATEEGWVLLAGCKETRWISVACAGLVARHHYCRRSQSFRAFTNRCVGKARAALPPLAPTSLASTLETHLQLFPSDDAAEHGCIEGLVAGRKDWRGSRAASWL